MLEREREEGGEGEKESVFLAGEGGVRDDVAGEHTPASASYQHHPLQLRRRVNQRKKKK